MNQHHNQAPQSQLQRFASLRWYDATIRFTFSFVAKTSEILLAAGVVVSTANFLTDGSVMGTHTGLAEAWSWAQALAIDSSLGIVCMNGFQAVREHERMKAIIFFVLTAILAMVAGLLTHFDALSHATGLPVTDKGISGVIPLWILTGLRAIAVIGFLLVSRLKDVSFASLRQDWTRRSEPAPSPPVAAGAMTSVIDPAQLASAIIQAMQQAGAMPRTIIDEGATPSLPMLKAGAAGTEEGAGDPQLGATHQEAGVCEPEVGATSPQPGATEQGEGVSYTEAGASEQVRETNTPALGATPTIDQTTADRLALAYQMLLAEREQSQRSKPISARELAGRANVRRSTCGEWLRTYRDIQAARDDPAK